MVGSVSADSENDPPQTLYDVCDEWPHTATGAEPSKESPQSAQDKENQPADSNTDTDTTNDEVNNAKG